MSAGDRALHPLEELPELVAGTLPLDEARQVTAHLRGCASCRGELVDIVAAIGALRLARDVDAVPADLPPLAIGRLAAVPSLPGPPPRRSSRRPALIGGVAAAVVAVVLVVSFLVTRSSPSKVAVAFEPVGASGDSGTVAMTTSGTDRTMTVEARLQAAQGGSFYEVWLLDEASGRMLPVGVLPSDGRATFSLPADLVATYDAVDVSLEPDDGEPAHSSDSVLRAKFRPTG